MRRVIVDGYNVVHAWPDLATSLRRHGLEEARRRLITRLAEYRASSRVDVVVVFDAHFRKRGAGDKELIDGVEVRYGSSHESADHVIERLIYEAVRRGVADDTVVATNDRLQRDMVAAMGVPTMSAEAFGEEVGRAAQDRGSEIRRRQDEAGFAGRIEHRIDPDVLRQLEDIRRGRSPAGPADPTPPGEESPAAPE